MNLVIVYDMKKKSPQAVIVHNFNTGDIGYSTYNNELSNILDIILKSDINMIKSLDNITYNSKCDLKNSFYLSCLNDYLPYPYKITWIKNIDDNIDKLLEEAYDILQ